MTDTRGPKPCHYDRALRQRVTTDHRDDCPRGADCPAVGRGCAPCTAPHCAVCGREHATNATPQTCPSCQRKVDEDLADIQASYTALAVEAMEAGHDGHLVAAAPIPGGDAAVLIGPTVRRVRASKHLRDDHRPTDPLPPLAVVAHWEDIYRKWLDHDKQGAPTTLATWGQLVVSPRRASIAGGIRYLRDQVPNIAQRTDGPDWLEFTHQVRRLRAMLERALHDEREPERGVECFECGDQLVRRFRQAKSCRHTTPARKTLTFWGRLGYPEALTTADVRAARQPCGRCDQGGIDDPRAGLSWECPGCRKEYKPGEYANAVRRDLLDNGADGDGWTHVGMAADAATTLVGVAISEERLRKWADRGKVASCCLWTAGRSWGQRLVYWPDVADEANAAVERARRAVEARRRRAAKEAAEAKEAKAS